MQGSELGIQFVVVGGQAAHVALQAGHDPPELFAVRLKPEPVVRAGLTVVPLPAELLELVLHLARFVPSLAAVQAGQDQLLSAAQQRVQLLGGDAQGLAGPSRQQGGRGSPAQDLLALRGRLALDGQGRRHLLRVGQGGG